MKTHKIGYNSYPHYYTLKGLHDKKQKDPVNLTGKASVTGAYDLKHPIVLGDEIELPDSSTHTVTEIVSLSEPKGNHAIPVKVFLFNTTYKVLRPTI